MARYPSRSYDVQRTSSFHSARCAHDLEPPAPCDAVRRAPACRVHSLQNISRRRDADALPDQLLVRLPPDTGYNVPKPVRSYVLGD